MQITQIVRMINDKLAGENLSYDALKTHMDAVIDDINAKLNSSFPAFSEFTMVAYPKAYPDYNFFPDKYIRTVVGFGTAYKFFTVDEEGADFAKEFKQEYLKALFYMERDYINQVNELYQEVEQGYIENELTVFAPLTYWD